MKRSNVFLATCLLVSAISSQALAGDTTSYVRVVQIDTTDSESAVFVSLAQAINSRPACATATSTFVVDTSTARGKQMMTLLHSALLSGMRVRARGTGNCNFWTGFETLRTVYMSAN